MHMVLIRIVASNLTSSFCIFLQSSTNFVVSHVHHKLLSQKLMLVEFVVSVTMDRVSVWNPSRNFCLMEFLVLLMKSVERVSM